MNMPAIPVVDLSDPEVCFETPPVRKLIYYVLLLALKDRATEVRFEPRRGHFTLSYRVDGVLYEMVPPPADLGPRITNTLKVMADLGILRRNALQRGLFEFRAGDHSADMLVSVQPTPFGESVLLDILDPTAAPAEAEQILQSCLAQREGPLAADAG